MVENIGLMPEQYLPICLICVRELGFGHDKEKMRLIFGPEIDNQKIPFLDGDA
jgi:hypothetical protein